MNPFKNEEINKRHKIMRRGGGEFFDYLVGLMILFPPFPLFHTFSATSHVTTYTFIMLPVIKFSPPYETVVELLKRWNNSQ